MPPNKGSQSPTSMARPNNTWAEVARASPGSNADLAIKLPTYHTVAKDQANPYSFAANPHLLIICRYSGSNANKNELVFIHVYLVGQATTREMLQRYRTEAHASIHKRLGVNPLYTDALGDTVTVVTKNQKSTKGNGF